MQHIRFYIDNPRMLGANLLYKFGYFMSDKWYLCLLYYFRTGKKLNLDHPQTFNEKLQWMKLYDRQPLYTTLVDKYAVKEYVSKKIGSQYIIPTFGVWDKFDDIDFCKLPNQFVLKCTHDSGGLIICKDKSKLDIVAAKHKIEKSLKTNFYLLGREWPYKDVPRRIIAEEYKEDKKTKELRDYKFFCFDGSVKALFIASDRQNRDEPYFDFFDEDFNHLPMRHGHPNAPTLPERPLCFEKMKRFASILSEGLREVRVDFYEVDGRIFFGELTFFHHNGMVPFEPASWDERFGRWIKIDY